jgi:hypothetical protein
LILAGIVALIHFDLGSLWNARRRSKAGRLRH